MGSGVVSDLVPWLVAAVAAGGGIAAFLRARSAGLRTSELAEALSQRESELRSVRKRSDRRREDERQRGEERGQLRRKLEKARKRAAEARDERDAERVRACALEQRVSELETDLRDARTGLERARAAAAHAAAPAPPPGPAIAEREAEAARRATRAEEGLRDARAELDRAHREVTRLRDRSRTQDKLYTSLRLELEAKKDRVRAQQEQLERLRALRVALGAREGEDADANVGAAEPGEDADANVGAAEPGEDADAGTTPPPT